jgi:hypothetical protein
MDASQEGEKKMEIQTAKINRNSWGAIVSADQHAKMILADAMLDGVLEPEYCDVDHKHRGSALNYDIYDYVDNAILVQKRHTTCDKYGNHPQKDYIILMNINGEVVRADAPHKMAIARAAKLNPPIGHILHKITKCTAVSEMFACLVAVPKLQGVRS